MRLEGPAIVDLSGDRAMPVGIDSFEQVVRGYVYVDKTPLVAELVASKARTVLFCRPRRFGKSLAMDMLRRFFEAPVEGWVSGARDLFEPLAVWRAGERCRAEQGAYPVVSLSLKSASGTTWQETRSALVGVLSDEYRRHAYLLESHVFVTRGERERYERMIDMEPRVGELERSLVWLTRLLARHHGAPCVVLVDEYDAPVTAGHAHGFREEAVTFTRNWLTDAVKTNRDLRLACLTGVQRISRESIFSGLNNLEVDTALDHRYAEGFGFTDAEVEALLAHVGEKGRMGEVRSWFDGYNFGGTSTYNPWSVISYVKAGCVAQPYWTNTSGNQIVHGLFSRVMGMGGQDAADLAVLADGGLTSHPLDLNMDFASLEQDPSAVWAQLYLSGYVTTDDVAFPADGSRVRRLRVPNHEVAMIYRQEFLARARSLAGGAARLEGLHAALVAGDASALERELARVLLDSPSLRDLLRENSYHMLMLGLLYCVPGYLLPQSNRERGRGYFDLVLVPDGEHERSLPAIVVELKRGHDAKALPELARDALAQVMDRSYDRDLAGEGVLRWGVAFCGKGVACACERG